MSPEKQHHDDFVNSFATFFDTMQLDGYNYYYDKGTDVFLWAIMKELLVPKIRQQDRKIKDLESRLKVIEDHLVREESAKFSLAMQATMMRSGKKKREKKEKGR